MKYNDEEASKILLNRLKKDRMLLAKLRSSSAYKELDENVASQVFDSLDEEDKQEITKLQTYAEDGIIKDCRQMGHGCSISMASASILTEIMVYQMRIE